MRSEFFLSDFMPDHLHSTASYPRVAHDKVHLAPQQAPPGLMVGNRPGERVA